ncbi:MAG: ABC transporter permease subunit [Rhizobiales bacterium]|nr:ABC transporter permease subunit [Hyphomicrobiales bacterium]
MSSLTISGRHPLSPFGITPKVVILVLILGIGTIPPLLFLIFASVHSFNPDGSFAEMTLAHFHEIFTSRAFFTSLFNSVVYSFGSALLALAIGAAQAWLAERTDAPFRQWLYVTAIISLGIPYVLYIVAWLLFLGKAGSVNQLLAFLFGGTGPYINVNSLGGMIFIEGMLWSPLAFLLLSSVFRNADAAFEEAATMCGASLPATLRHVTFGMAQPALFALALLVFIKASESFEVPALVGLPGGTRVVTTTVYQRLTLDMPPSVGSASALGVLLLVVMAVLLHFYGRLSAQAHRFRTVTGKGFRPRVIRLGRWRYPVTVLIALIPIVVVIIPLVTIIWAALLPFYQPFSIDGLSRLRLTNFIQVLTSPSARGAVFNSLVLGAATATLVTALGAVAGWCVARRVTGGRLIDALAALPLVFPAIVLGLAYLQILVHGVALYGTLLSLILVSAVAYIPYGLRYAQLGVIQIHPELEEAAGIAGAGYPSTFVRVVLPLLVPALISCWLFVFLLAVRAMALVLLLAGPESQVVAVSLFDLWNNGPIGEVAALGFVWTVIMTFFSVAFFVLARRYQLPIG